jgi:hypothetical protein
MVTGGTGKRKRSIISSRDLLCAIFIVSLLALSCSPAESPSGEIGDTTNTSQSPFPLEKFNKAKSLSRDGYALYGSAMQEEDQGKRDEMLEKVLQEYYFPAQSILSAIREKFAASEEASGVDGESQDLNRKIDDVVRSKGAPRGG